MILMGMSVIASTPIEILERCTAVLPRALRNETVLVGGACGRRCGSSGPGQPTAPNGLLVM
jgi:hypothetical protein